MFFISGHISFKRKKRISNLIHFTVNGCIFGSHDRNVNLCLSDGDLCVVNEELFPTKFRITHNYYLKYDTTLRAGSNFVAFVLARIHSICF